VSDFGVPRFLAWPVALLLPVAEIAIAAELVPATTARWAAVAAVALLGLFLIGIVVNLARGRRPDCHCFGQLHSSPVGPLTAVRNLLLVGLAVLVIVQEGPSAPTWWEGLTDVERMGVGVGGVAAVLFVLQGWFLASLFMGHGRTLLRLDELEEGLLAVGAGVGVGEGGAGGHVHQALGLPVGTPAPEFSLPGLYGETSTLTALCSAGRPVLLLFTDPGCAPCQTLVPDIAGWQETMADRLTIAVISRGAPEANREKFAAAGVSGVLLQGDQEVAESYRYGGTPGAVVVGPDGTVASPVVRGPDEIRRLVGSIAGTPSVPVPLGRQSGNGNGQHRPSAPAVGDPAPPVVLPDLDGNTVDLASGPQPDRLLLFWNPGCGFCQQMLPELREWEEQRADGPEPVVISTGSVDDNRQMGLRSPVLLDDDFSVAPRFGAHGTPMAIVVDGEGRIASELAVGAQAVMALARRADTPSG
jgi:thiol-disulfide isomerase/thioredoxin